MRIVRTAVGAAGLLVAVRVVRSRQRRFLHPDGRSFIAELEWRLPGDPVAAPERAIVRLSKGAGTRGARADIRGVAIRVHRSGRDLDLLLSTAGTGRFTRHLPAPRRSFDVLYGSITPYRTEAGDKVYLLARPDPTGPAFGRTLAGIEPGGRLLLAIRRGAAESVIGRVELCRPLESATDAALAFDPVRNSWPALHPTGLVHGLRAVAYRASQRWRGAEPPPVNPVAVSRTTRGR